jgi:hypothetical protein
MTFLAPPPDAPRTDGPSFANYVRWHARGSADHGIPPAQFSMRASGAGNPLLPCPQMATGIVWDIDNIVTGWLSWPKGGVKDYRANPDVSKPLPFPGAGFTENIQIPMALDANMSACWDQASTGSWKGFCEVAAMIAQQSPQNPSLLPVIACVGSTLTSTGQNSTQVPNFQILSWVQRPPCLMPQEQSPAAPPTAGYNPVYTQPPVVPAAPPAPPPAAPPAPPAPPAAEAWGVAPAPAAPAAPGAPAGAWN